MDTTIIALRNLYVAMGGEAADVANLSLIPDLINAIAELISGGTFAGLPQARVVDEGKFLTVQGGKWKMKNAPTELPEVTDDDNGKVLKVLSGAWGVGEDATT